MIAHVDVPSVDGEQSRTSCDEHGHLAVDSVSLGEMDM